jgi:hypothetical protein
MYKKSSANMDKRITKCIIVATVFIGIVATAPSARVALAQQPTGKLDLENYFSANCPFPAEHCPQGSNTGAVTTVYWYTPTTPAKEYSKEFNLGTWGIPNFNVADIPVGWDYKITTKVPTRQYTFDYDGNKYKFWLTDVAIQALKNGCKAGPQQITLPECASKMSDAGASIKVVYWWASEGGGGDGDGIAVPGKR